MAGRLGVVFGAAIAVVIGSAPVYAAGANNSDSCRYATASNAACRGANTAGASRPYERWQDGSPAVGSSVAPQRYSPTYFRGYNALYGFGR